MVKVPPSSFLSIIAITRHPALLAQRGYPSRWAMDDVLSGSDEKCIASWSSFNAMPCEDRGVPFIKQSLAVVVPSPHPPWRGAKMMSINSTHHYPSASMVFALRMCTLSIHTAFVFFFNATKNARRMPIDKDQVVIDKIMRA